MKSNTVQFTVRNASRLLWVAMLFGIQWMTIYSVFSQPAGGSLEGTWKVTTITVETTVAGGVPDTRHYTSVADMKGFVRLPALFEFSGGEVVLYGESELQSRGEYHFSADSLTLDMPEASYKYAYGFPTSDRIEMSRTVRYVINGMTQEQVTERLYFTGIRKP